MKFVVPKSFSLIKKGKTYLLLKDGYKDLLLQQGIEDIEGFLEKKREISHYLQGRTPHPSVSLEDGKRIVFRHYTHGGLLGAIWGDRYLLGSRSFQELALTEEVRSCAIPTVQPVGAIHRSTLSPFYQAYFLSLEIPQAKHLIQYFHETGSPSPPEYLLQKRKLIRMAGLLLRKFHQSGFFHGDLQLKNILVAEDEVFLIDFDRAYRKPSLTLRERKRNLCRLNRSVEKWKRLGLPVTRTDRWRFFLAYAGGDEEIRQAMKRAMRSNGLCLLLHRMGWTIEKVLGSKGGVVKGNDLFTSRTLDPLNP
jgi:3-deoxy-D-manno-octulosonic acid kinase